MTKNKKIFKLDTKDLQKKMLNIDSRELSTMSLEQCCTSMKSSYGEKQPEG